MIKRFWLLILSFFRSCIGSELFSGLSIWDEVLLLGEDVSILEILHTLLYMVSTYPLMLFKGNGPALSYIIGGARIGFQNTLFKACKKLIARISLPS